MSKVYIDDSVFTNIADAIRDRNGETATYKPREMDDAIKDLHNVRVKKWERPSDWPDYSKVDLTNQEVIYLTYDCTYGVGTYNFISIRVVGAYHVERGSLNNGIFTSVFSTDQDSNTIFQQTLPTDEGDYVVYKITPQSSEIITSFRFSYMVDENSSYTYGATDQPCVERYCNIPNHTAIFPTSNYIAGTYDCWITHLMVADTVMNAKPNGSCNDSYRHIRNRSLRYVDLSTCSFANVTSLQYMFYSMPSIQEIYLPHDVSNKCTNLVGTFQSCANIVNLDLSGWDTSGVIRFDGAFRDCLCLCEIKGIEDFNFTKATRMDSMFNNDYHLRYLNSSKWQTTTVLTNLGSMFNYCRHLEHLDLSGFITDNVQNYNSMFCGCFSLREIDLSSFNISNKATNLGNMFQYCRSLKKIIRNKNWDTSNVTSFEAMFQECTLLKEIDISDFSFITATTIKTMFSNCTALQTIKANIDLPKLVTKTNVQNFASTCWNLDPSEITFTNCTYMPYFGYCYTGLHYIKIPASVTTIPTDTFRDCFHLYVVDFRDHTAVPTLDNANAFILNSNTRQKIVIPDALYDTWIATAPWNSAKLVARIIKASDYENEKSMMNYYDLSQCTWVKNISYSESSAVGTAYADMVSNGSGNRITSGLIILPSAAIGSFTISANEGYQFGYTGYDDNGLYLKKYNNWQSSAFTVNDSSIKQIAIFVKNGNGTALDPADWAATGITLSYPVQNEN